MTCINACHGFASMLIVLTDFVLVCFLSLSTSLALLGWHHIPQNHKPEGLSPKFRVPCLGFPRKATGEELEGAGLQPAGPTGCKASVRGICVECGDRPRWSLHTDIIQDKQTLGHRQWGLVLFSPQECRRTCCRMSKNPATPQHTSHNKLNPNRLTRITGPKANAVPSDHGRKPKAHNPIAVT